MGRNVKKQKLRRVGREVCTILMTCVVDTDYQDRCSQVCVCSGSDGQTGSIQSSIRGLRGEGERGLCAKKVVRRGVQ